MADNLENLPSEKLRAMKERYEQMVAAARERLRAINVKLEALSSSEMTVMTDPESADQ